LHSILANNMWVLRTPNSEVVPVYYTEYAKDSIVTKNDVV